ncbi:hypothetical protein NDR87_37070 [Nocardia sp. CDC159]|nr:hypothetical protein [Nocardia sp. CDC159]MCM6790942.1 hypothetical protein [Nocardia sp. CDC159]MCM6791986.1 hypothetical protein [Nocardia sp. CDC159]
MPTYKVTLRVFEDDPLSEAAVKAKILDACEDAPISFDIDGVEVEQ